MRRTFSYPGWHILFVLTLCLLPAYGGARQESAQEVYPEVTPKQGERCIICGVPVSEDDVTLLVRGRRVPLKSGMVDSFMNNREQYFSELQPKGALVQENLSAPRGVAQGGINLGWFLFGLHVLVALLFGGLSGYAAVSKGLAPVPHFFIGFVFSLFGYLYVLSRPPAVELGTIPEGLTKVPETGQPVACDKCGNRNHPGATRCAACGTALEPAYESEASRVTRQGGGEHGR